MRVPITLPLLLTLTTALLGAGCAEWDRYWDADTSPTGPVVEPDTAPPTVSLLSPAGPDSSLATPVGGADYRIVIEAEDEGGVQTVDLFLDGEFLAGLGAPPWEIEWDTTDQGEASTHTLLATAVDSAGNVGTSAPAFARVFNSGPDVDVVSPADSALVLGEITLQAEFPGEHAEIETVEFRAGFFPIGETTGEPWALAIDTALLPSGWWPITAMATTVLGEIGLSPRVWIHVNNDAPTVSIDFPPSGHAVATRGTLVLEGTAIDGQEGELPEERVVWSSDVDGEIGTGSTLWISGLTVGTHTISLTGANAWGTPAAPAIQVEVMAEGTYTFCQDIYRGVIEGHICRHCHEPGSSEFPTMEYDLSTYDSMMAGGLTTIFRAIYPCKPDSSFFYNKISTDTPWVGDPMPPDDVFPPITPSSLEKVRVWILEGAPPDDPEECR